MGALHQFLCHVSFNTKQMDRHSHGNTESFSFSRQRPKGYRRVNCYILWNPDVALSSTNLKAPMKQAA